MSPHAEPDDSILAIAAPRHTDRPFPPYRFLPGHHPHPASPQGHSYHPPGHAPTKAEYQPPEHWNTCDDYLYGCDLYNNAYWWEAHEAWEDLWRLCPRDSAQRSWVQGLIQAAACHLKLRLGRREAIERLLESSTGHFQSAKNRIANPDFMGVDVPDFISRFERYYAAVLSQPDPIHHDPATFPYVRPAPMP